MKIICIKTQMMRKATAGLNKRKFSVILVAEHSLGTERSVQNQEGFDQSLLSLWTLQSIKTSRGHL